MAQEPQSTLNQFYEAIVPSSKRRSSKTYLVQWVNGRHVCQCRQWIYEGIKCTHIKEAENSKILQALNYFQTRKEVERHGWFKSVDEVMFYFIFRDDAEFNYLSNLFLHLLYPREKATTDDIRFCVENCFTHNPSIVGSVVGGLRARGYIEKVTYVETKMETGRHRSHIALWQMTDKGRAEFQGEYER